MSLFRTIHAITLDGAIEIVRLTIDEARRRQIPGTVAVVDPSLQLIAFAKSDGAPPDAEELSRRKATAAATMNKPSGDIPEELVGKLIHATEGVFTNLGGGLPIRFGGLLAGAIGITGGGPAGGQAVVTEIGRGVLEAVGADAV